MGRNERRPTLKTIAAMTGLGVTTVSRALKDAPDIGERTKARVREAARSVGYRPDRAGVRLRTGRTQVVSLVLSTELDALGLSSFLVHGLASSLAGTAFHLVVTPFSRGEDPMRPVRYVVESGAADGIVFADTEPEDARAAYLLDAGFPFAAHGRTDFADRHAWFDFDNRAFARGAVERLAALGCRRLAFVAPPAHLAYGRHAREGWREGIERAAVREVAFGPLTLDDPHERLLARARALLGARRPVDGFVCSGARAALAVVAAGDALGLVAGEHYRVVAKESHGIIARMFPGVIAVQEDYMRAGTVLGAQLTALIGGADPAALHELDVPEFPDAGL